MVLEDLSESEGVEDALSYPSCYLLVISPGTSFEFLLLVPFLTMPILPAPTVRRRGIGATLASLKQTRLFKVHLS